jgi:ABC-2 type transport system permease protein
MRRYIKIAKTAFLLQIVYRGHVYLTAIGNIIYLVLIYYLWRAIFSGSQGTLHGTTFEQTFLRLGCASSMFVLFRTYMEWYISRDIISGDIIVRLIKPVDYQYSQIARATGAMVFSLFFVALPTFVGLFFLFGNQGNVSPAGIILFIPSIIIAFLLSTIIDYCIGCVAFYTESIWGISTAKEAIVLFLSGAMIPVTFFPEIFQTVIKCLPFQAIYSLPLTILFSNTNFSENCQLIAVQCFWLVIMIVLSRILFTRASRAVTVNGG